MKRTASLLIATLLIGAIVFAAGCGASSTAPAPSEGVPGGTPSQTVNETPGVTGTENPSSSTTQTDTTKVTPQGAVGQ